MKRVGKFNNLGSVKKISRSDYLKDEEIKLILYAMLPANALVCELSLATGLRIGDCLSLTKEQIERQRFTIREQKTGKPKRIYIPHELQKKILQQCPGCKYAFPSRHEKYHYTRPRTRQAVYMDIKRVCKAFKYQFKDITATPHSMRKTYAVREFAALDGDLEKLRKKFNHDSVAVTMIYALADHLRKKKPTVK